MESILYIETSLPPATTLNDYRRTRVCARRSNRLLRRLLG
jgi:hypothetical protein